MAPTRWGICSAGKISNDFVLCMKHLARHDRCHEAVAVAARSEQDAKFLGDHCADVSVRRSGSSGVKTFLEAGKAVLCEKPMTMCVEHTEHLVGIARKKKVFLMEAICTPFLEFYGQMLRGLKEIGPIQHMIIPFGSPSLSNVKRLVEFDLGGSLILDCVVYSINMALDVFQKLPEEHVALGSVNNEGVDVNSTIVLRFDGGALCTMISSATCAIPKVTQIFGTKGSIELHAEGAATRITVCGVSKKQSEVPEISGFYYHPWLGGEIKHVRECLLKGLTESPVVPLQRSIYLAQLMGDSIHQIKGRVRIIED